MEQILIGLEFDTNHILTNSLVIFVAAPFLPKKRGNFLNRFFQKPKKLTATSKLTFFKHIVRAIIIETQAQIFLMIYTTTTSRYDK